MQQQYLRVDFEVLSLFLPGKELLLTHLKVLKYPEIARRGFLLNKQTNPKYRATAMLGETEWTNPKKTERVSRVKGGAHDGSSWRCHALSRRQPPGKQRFKDGWKYCRLERVSPAKETPSPSCHKNSMYSSTWESNCVFVGAICWFCPARNETKRRNAFLYLSTVDGRIIKLRRFPSCCLLLWRSAFVIPSMSGLHHFRLRGRLDGMSAGF